jgi:2-keto-4-pentenoate hydratase/2-oxohepta-3-ene-1,7-dioic acid hydratase in catechol pathway
MRLVSVNTEGGRRAGILEGERVYVTRIGGLEVALEQGVDLSGLPGTWRPRDAMVLDAPLRPPVVLCAGQNYHDHLDEKAPVDVRDPEFFIKAGQTITTPDEACVLEPAVTHKLDYETELGVVIGTPGRRIAAADAHRHIAGYVVLNDLTARDRQVVRNADGSFAMALGPGKNFDGSTRMAPWVTTADEVPDPHALALTTRVNGKLRQSNTTGAMVFSIGDIVAYLSNLLTLQPGTIIATGTPGGTGWGTDAELGGTSVTPAGCEPGRYLSDGDTVTSAIEGVGELSFAVRASQEGDRRLDAAA